MSVGFAPLLMLLLSAGQEGSTSSDPETLPKVIREQQGKECELIKAFKARIFRGFGVISYARSRRAALLQAHVLGAHAVVIERTEDPDLDTISALRCDSSKL